ncbi:MICOS complex subunit MIC27 [Oryzias melastigma]|uniref:MICOS complex subunit n=1 Tax=Oryzias melastigma TaxID=30732 RepID=A0A834EXG6_ORYME|nr:MICOS complex subunit MIC27 [Oryzias melastigma]
MAVVCYDSSGWKLRETWEEQKKKKEGGRRSAVMAAKVVKVAVPTVLGIASIRVYTVNGEPADGLVSRSKLNIYTPLPDSAPATFVAESPGLIERGVTITRESVVPLVQAVKDACVFVKNGSVNIYHGGEDVYYYLIDPPPGFLPRFGTITMAGLLGMFLARKGSRFKRLAVPLGLMSAAASVCYPAQAVTALKVTGRKVYAAGRWSSAAASSLLSSKKPVSTEILAPQPQAATEPNPSSSQSPAVTDVSPPAPDEPVAPVTTEEEPSEISTHQPPTEPSSASLGDSLPEETQPSPPTDESAAPARSEEGKQVSVESSVESTGSSQTEEAPVESSIETSADDESTPPPAVTPSDVPSEPGVDSSEPVAELEPQQSPAQQPATENSTEGSSFKPDPALMDFGQSSPEDEDLYSTRS